jgi:hypothetical protein
MTGASSSCLCHIDAHVEYDYTEQVCWRRSLVAFYMVELDGVTRTRPVFEPQSRGCGALDGAAPRFRASVSDALRIVATLAGPEGIHLKAINARRAVADHHGACPGEPIPLCGHKSIDVSEKPTA